MNRYGNEMLGEYKESREALRYMLSNLQDENLVDKEDKRVINYALREISYVINWLEQGYEPSKRKERFVYGVDGYWDEDIGAFIDTGIYKDPYIQVEEKIDSEMRESRAKRN